MCTDAQQKRMRAGRKVSGIMRLSGPSFEARSAGITRPATPTPLMIRIKDAAALLSMPIVFLPKDPSFFRLALVLSDPRHWRKDTHIEYRHPHPHECQKHSSTK